MVAGRRNANKYEWNIKLKVVDKYENNNEFLRQLNFIIISYHIVDESGVIPKK